MTTIQEANVAHLRELDPDRVLVVLMQAPTRQNCDTDSHHGKGVCWMLAQLDQEPCTLCLSCAIVAAEKWLTSDVCDYLTIAVTR
jgi:hypothetical protein